MFAVIFEVTPRTERFDDYLALAKSLRPQLDAIDGFIDIDRFASRRAQGRVLSLSIWRDDKAVTRWRTHAAHHRAQQTGRFEVFADYRLRVGEITVDTAPPPGYAVVQQRFDETETGDAKVVTISVIAGASGGTVAAAPDALAAHLGLRAGADGLVDCEAFESIYHPGELLLLAGWRDADAARAWSPTEAEPGRLRHRHVRVIRDYGMSDRREAPQFYPEVRREGAESPRRQASGR